EEIRNGIQAQTVDALIEPEAQDLDHFLLHGQVVEVQVWLVAEKTMPVVLARLRVPRPVGRLSVSEDNARVSIPLIRVAPDVVLTKRRRRIRAGGLKPRVLV